jgi:hypothetical protein
MNKTIQFPVTESHIQKSNEIINKHKYVIPRSMCCPISIALTDCFNLPEKGEFFDETGISSLGRVCATHHWVVYAMPDKPSVEVKISGEMRHFMERFDDRTTCSPFPCIFTIEVPEVAWPYLKDEYRID